jgi:type III secretory pathway component EscU
MPTFSLVEIGKIIFKVAVIAIIAGLIVSFVGSFVTIISDVVSNLSGVGSLVNGLNLGWFANTIGLVDFLNTMMNVLYIAGSTLISGVITILGFKYGMKFYTHILRV